MWADQSGWKWLLYDLSRLIAAVVLLFVAILGDPGSLLNNFLMAYVLVGLWARLPWKKLYRRAVR